MARSVSASLSRKLCPPNKFNFMSGCMAWSTILSLISLFALIIVCMLIMSSRDIKYEIKKNDIIEEQKLMRNSNITINGINPNNQISFDNWYFFPIGVGQNQTETPRGFYQWAVENKYKVGVTHPLEDAHKDAALLVGEEMVKVLNNHVKKLA